MSYDDLYAENVRRISDALATSMAKRAEFERQGAEHHLKIVNVTQFALIWNADLSALLHELKRLQKESGEAAGWKRKLSARLLALTIVEAADEFRSLLGGSFRASVNELCSDPAILKEVGAVHKRLNTFRDVNDAALRRVRNTVVAHRNADAAAQIEVLRNVSVKQMEAFGFELLNWTNDLLNLLTKIVTHTGSGTGGTSRSQDRDPSLTAGLQQDAELGQVLSGG